MKTYLKLLSYLKPYWKRLLLAIGCMVVVGALSAVPAYLLKYVVDDLFIERKPLMLMALPLAVIGTYLIKGFFSYVQTYLMYWIGQRVVMDVRNHLYTHLINMPLSFFSNVTTGEMMSKIIYDISLMQKAASQAVRDMGRHFFSFLFLLGVAFYMNWFLTTIFLIALPPLALL
ncbi:MAG: ABC transporter transmembrane domain-containing protein, partial [Nitrospinota bacterium]